MKAFGTSVVIRSSPEAIWAILSDVATWPGLDSSIDRVEGEIALGGKITVHSKITPGRAFPVVVSELRRPEKIVLRGGMPLGLFKGERTYTLARLPEGAVEFTMREVFSGLLAPLISRSIPDLQPYFDEFGAGLKARAEGSEVR